MNAELIATSTARLRFKFLHLHLNPLERMLTTKFGRKCIPRRKNGEGEMNKSSCKREGGTVSLCGHRKQGHRKRQRLVSHGSISQGKSFDFMLK